MKIVYEGLLLSNCFKTILSLSLLLLIFKNDYTTTTSKKTFQNSEFVFVYNIIQLANNFLIILLIISYNTK